MKLKHYCDNCQYQINEEYEEVPIYLIELPNNDIFFFCSEDCRDEFIKSYFTEGYILPNGVIDKD